MAVPVRLKSIPLWEERWSSEKLKAKAAAEPGAWPRGFLLQAISDEDKTFPSFHKCKKSGVRLEELQRMDWPAFTGVDLSAPKRKGNAIFTARLDPRTNRRYVVDIRRGAWKANETAAQMAEVNSIYRPLVIRVEDNAYQTALLDFVDADKSGGDMWAKVEPTTTGSEKRDAEIGLPGLQIEFHHEAWIVPTDSYESHEVGCQCAWCVWDREVSNHPLAATSDCVMAMWFCQQGIRDFGGYVAPPPLGNTKIR